MKYHIKNKNSKKELKKSRMKPIPLMRIIKDDEIERTKINDGRDTENPYFNEII